MIVYTIQAGDTLWKIARANHITLDALVAANPQMIACSPTPWPAPETPVQKQAISSLTNNF